MPVFVVNDSDLPETLSAHDRVIIQFHADWCGSCKLFAPQFRRLSDDLKFTSVSFVSVNSENNPIARKLANVDNLPFFATFRNGSLVENTATAKEETVVGMLERLMQ
ncbi:MAG: thioredoxin [Ignavibacteria bacterium]|nr:thioredoxin [Ignavibacteria bacterium]